MRVGMFDHDLAINLSTVTHRTVPGYSGTLGRRHTNRAVLALVHIFSGKSTGAGAFLLVEFGIIIDRGLVIYAASNFDSRR